MAITTKQKLIKIQRNSVYSVVTYPNSDFYIQKNQTANHVTI